jgi:exopolysaccharide production protein ExoQ
MTANIKVGPDGFALPRNLQTAPRPAIFTFLASGHAAIALCLIVGLATALTGAFANDAGGFEDRESGSALIQALGLLVYLPTLIFFLVKPDLPIRTIAQGWLLMLLQTIILISPLWAVEPDVSLRRAISLTIEMIFILHVATYFSAREFIRLMSWIFAVFILASLLALALPGIGITPDGTHAGRMRGIFANKNTMGEVAAVAAISFIILAITANTKSRERWLFIGLAVLAFAELLLANSRSPLIALVAAVAAIWSMSFIYFPQGWQKSVARSVRVSLVAAGALFATIVLPIMATIILALLGRTTTLSGRTKLWEYALGKGTDRPWFGAGYKSFWTDKLTFDMRVLHEHWDMEPGAKALTANAHNGYIDIWLELGFVGLTVGMLLFAMFGKKAVAALYETGNRIYLWHIGMLTFAMVYYLTESAVMGYNQLAWFLVAYGFLSLCAREVRTRRIS